MHSIFNAPGRRRVSARACAVIALLCAASTASAAASVQAAALSLEASLQSATDHSAALQAALASVRASTQAAARAGQLPDPTLKAGVDNLPVNGDQRFTVGGDFMTMRRIGIEQEWVSSDKRRLRSDLGERVVDRQRSGYLTQVANIRQQTAIAWLNALYAKKSAAVAQALVDHMTHELAATTASYRGARTTASDVTQARLMLAQAQDQALKTQQAERTALIGLSRWTVTPVSDVSGEPPSLDSAVPALAPDQLARVQPTLVTGADDIAVADADTAVATSNRSSNWTWEVAYQQRGPQFSNMVSVGVSIPLPINRSQRQDRDVAEKTELAERARLSYQDTQRQVEADIRTLGTLLANGRERIANLQGSLLPAAEQRVALANAAYRGGAGTLADVFAARRSLLDSQLQVFDLQRDVALVWAQLEFQVLPPSMADR
ncbi:TolC family protein [Pandoraea oxalativorans]|uniref:Transporter n=1 Tax=Pandoraea oxalativorans TaxID=573737 RepID=A0A0E3U734_9BURK|nr:TolC family protein [Pandoraea oxalativorans]AKC70519.1 transporter [Pandoraea oxalativorans]